MHDGEPLLDFRLVHAGAIAPEKKFSHIGGHWILPFELAHKVFAHEVSLECLGSDVVQCIELHISYWTLAFFAALRWLIQKALQDRQVIGQLHRLLTDGLHEGARVFVAMLTHHIGQRAPAVLGGGMIQAPL